MARFRFTVPKGKIVQHPALRNLFSFFNFLFFYCKKKTGRFFAIFEKNKNILVKFFMMKRGRYNRPFLHLATLGVLGIGIAVGPFLADTYPVFSQASAMQHVPSPSNKEQSITIDDNVFQTNISDKPRDKVITYAVEKGDTISTIANKFQISDDTVRWANDLTSDDLSIGQELKILPVSGVFHKVTKGETVYTIAKLYDTDPQKIVDFPFNDFANPETFSLVEGQTLIVPDGVKRAGEQPVRRPTPEYIAHQGPSSVSNYNGGNGYVSWPTRGGVTQYFTWYHPGIDIVNPIGTPLIAAHSGVVAQAFTGGYNGGYGIHVIIDHGDGFETLYAHMSSLNVGVGQHVVGGSTVIGWIGMTGRTTGAHVHFELHKGGIRVNPMAYLQ